MKNTNKNESKRKLNPLLRLKIRCCPTLIICSEHRSLGDETRFTQIFLNFLSNAFKFTPQKGNISVEIKPIEDEHGFLQKIDNEEEKESRQKDAMKKIMHRDSNSFDVTTEIEKLTDSEVKFDKYYVSFEIRIKDSGRGIAKENQDKLFLNFSKLADEEGLNKTGTGLGLSICKHLIEKMGGQVKVESEGIGHGTTFVIKLQAISRVEDIHYIPIAKASSNLENS